MDAVERLRELLATSKVSFHVQELRPEVLAFALLMEQRLREKDLEKGTQGWKHMGASKFRVAAYAKMIQMEREEFRNAPRHAIDIANYCMMIADAGGALEQPQ